LRGLCQFIFFLKKTKPTLFFTSFLGLGTEHLKNGGGKSTKFFFFFGKQVPASQPPGEVNNKARGGNSGRESNFGSGPRRAPGWARGPRAPGIFLILGAKIAIFAGENVAPLTKIPMAVNFFPPLAAKKKKHLKFFFFLVFFLVH